MRNRFRSFDEAKSTFDEYALAEPRLKPLWTMCQYAAPEPANDEVDAFDVDLDDCDPLGSSQNGWCAELWFLTAIQPAFRELVGWERKEDEPPHLRTTKAYEDVYAALLFFALNVTCSCCRNRAFARHA